MEIVTVSTLKRKKIPQIHNLNYHLKKPENKQKEENNKNQAEINEIENRKKINKIKNVFFGKVKKLTNL